MLEAGFEIPGVSHLKEALEVLKQEGIDVSGWPKEAQRSDAWGDPAGDNKLEFRSPEGRAVVLHGRLALVGGSRQPREVNR
jgi:hypothetical protein